VLLRPCVEKQYYMPLFERLKLLYSHVEIAETIDKADLLITGDSAFSKLYD
jgi:hypothetical protein